MMSLCRAAAVLTVGWALAGCGGGNADSQQALADGCYSGAAVPASMRTAVEAEAGRFYAAVRAGDAAGVLALTAQAVKNQGGEERFLTSIQRIIAALGLPEDFSTASVAYVKFGPGNPYTQRVQCTVPGTEDPLELLLTNHPEQVSTVQSGKVGGEVFFYSTLWFKEAEGWRLATFFAKPATLYGKDWQAYAEQASSERLAKHQRNAALLYNVALDLVVPTAWVKPPEVAELQREQRRIMVTGLPKGKLDAWPVEPDTVFVREVGYGIRSDALGLVVAYNARGAVADTTFQKADAERIRAYMATKYPEYAGVFGWLTLRAVDPEQPESEWTRAYRLEPGS